MSDNFNLNRIHEEEIKRVHDEEAMKYENMMKQWEDKLKDQAKEEAERKLSSRLSKVEMREENVKSLAAKLRAEHKEITKRLVEFQVTILSLFLSTVFVI